MWAARILLIGVLALAAISVIGTAIAIAAPYLAALIVLGGIGKVLYSALGKPADSDTQSR